MTTENLYRSAAIEVIGNNEPKYISSFAWRWPELTIPCHLTEKREINEKETKDENIF